MNAMPPGLAGTPVESQFVGLATNEANACSPVLSASNPGVTKHESSRVFHVGSEISLACDIQDLAASIASQNHAECWIVLTSARGVCKKIYSPSADVPSDAEISPDDLRNIAMEAYASKRPVLSGFPLEQLNSSSLVLEREIAKGSCQAIMAFSHRFQSMQGGFVVIIGWKSRDRIDYAMINSMMASTQAIVQSVEQWTLCDWGRKYVSITKNFSSWKKTNLWFASIVAVVLASLSWVPIPYYPKRECVIQPASRTFVASPIDGTLKEAYVRPGDKVQANHLLARLDEENLQRELSMARAEYEAAQKRQDRALSAKSGGDLRIAQLEREQIALKIQTLSENLEKLEARSLSDGVVVQGDWIGSEGMSVTTGQTLFEIAPLDRMTVEIHLLPEDLAWFQIGAKATLHSEASPGEHWEGTIERIDPSAEVADQKAYFVAELKVNNENGLLRPGMKGLVRIHGGYRSIGWTLFRSPYQWLQHQWIW